MNNQSVEFERIPRDKAYKLIVRASLEYSKSRNLRFGQCLWNLIDQDYPDVASQHCGNALDFYYTISAVEAADIFWTYYVGV